MSISVVKRRGGSDGKRWLPSLCQILKNLFDCSTCCSLQKGLMDADAVLALGTIQIMVGLFSIGIRPGQEKNQYADLTDLATYLPGAVYLASGLMSVLAGQFPSVFLVGSAVFMNIIGSILAIFGIVLYAIDLGDASFSRMCDWVHYSRENYDGCKRVSNLAQSLLTTFDITMIVLAFLQLCVCIGFAVLGLKALFSGKKEQADSDDEIYKPLMKNPGA